jgi:long-chain fatty acid transport protein
MPASQAAIVVPWRKKEGPVVRLDRELRFLAVFGLATALQSAPARAGGFAIHEPGSKANIFAGAFAAQADDLSAMFFNPAGMTQQKTFTVQFGDTLIAPRVKLDGANPYPGDGYHADMKNQIFFPPNLYVAYPVTQKFVLSLGTWFPYGLSTAWQNQDQFAGRYLSQRVDLRTYALSLQGAVELTDWLSIGGGPELRIGDVKLQRNVPVLNPFTNRVVDAAHVDVITDGFNSKLAWTVGLQLRPCPRLKIGGSFHSHVDIEFTGKARFYQLPTGSAQLDGALAQRLPFSQDVNASTIVQFPSLTMFGASYDITNRLTVEADAYYTTWKVFEDTVLKFDSALLPNGGITTLTHKWKNVWRFSGGLNFQATPSFNIGAGALYDETPQPDEDVSPLLPDANRTGFTIGGGVRFGSTRLEISNLFLFFHDRTTHTNIDNFNGTYKNFTDLLVLSLRHSF